MSTHCFWYLQIAGRTILIYLFNVAEPAGTFIKDQLTLDTPNLKSVSTWLDSLGYKSYLIGLSTEKLPDGTMRKGFAAIPVSGEYWDDKFEVCRDPFSYKKRRINCWVDAIAVKDGSVIKELG